MCSSESLSPGTIGRQYSTVLYRSACSYSMRRLSAAMEEFTGSMAGLSMPEWVTRIVSRRFLTELRTAQSSALTRHRVMIRTWLVRP